MKKTYIKAWVSEIEDVPSAFFEVSTVRHYLEQGVVSVEATRGQQKVIVFCDIVHGCDYLSKDELRLVAACWLDGNYNTLEIDLRH